MRKKFHLIMNKQNVASAQETRLSLMPNKFSCQITSSIWCIYGSFPSIFTKKENKEKKKQHKYRPIQPHFLRRVTLTRGLFRPYFSKTYYWAYILTYFVFFFFTIFYGYMLDYDFIGFLKILILFRYIFKMWCLYYEGSEIFIN